jgi:hypothetical protein
MTICYDLLSVFKDDALSGGRGGNGIRRVKSGVAGLRKSPRCVGHTFANLRNGKLRMAQTFAGLRNLAPRIGGAFATLRKPRQCVALKIASPRTTLKFILHQIIATNLKLIHNGD